jgi:hypothetical protein
LNVEQSLVACATNLQGPLSNRVHPIIFLSISASQQECIKSLSLREYLRGGGGKETTKDELVPKANHHRIRALFIISDDISHYVQYLTLVPNISHTQKKSV